MDALARLKKELANQSLLSVDSKESARGRGMSTAWLVAMASCSVKAGVNASITTGDMVSSYIRPILRGRSAKGASAALIDLVPPQHTGPPSMYIIHAWDAPFFDLVKQINAKSMSSSARDQEPTLATSPNSVISPDPHASFSSPPLTPLVHVWIDFAALPQLQLQANGESVISTSIIKDLILSCGGGALAVIDNELRILHRGWCLLEIFYAAYYLQPGGLQMVFSEHLDVNLAGDLDLRASTVDITKAICTLPCDRTAITSEAKKQIGIKRTNEVLRESIRRIARSTLRWGSIESLAVYCALLTEGGEFSILHCTLASLPDLAVDKDLLAEITAIFKVYDSDGSGELDEEEFVTVLGLAGFSPTEATKIFHEVNTDGGDGVGLDEFEEWWVSTQKANWKANHSKKAEMSCQSLTALVTSFVGLLDRTAGLESHTKFFKLFLARVQDPVQASEMLCHGKLVPPVIIGDWKGVCDQVTWKLTNDDDSKGCTNTLWHFLLSNADACSINVDELAPPRKDEDMCQKETYLLLHRQLLQLTEFLSLHPSRWRQMDYFERAAEEVRVKANCCDSDLPELNRKKKGKTGAKNKSWFTFGLIADMVHLKYGEEQTMSRRLIKEAGSALGRWMAANRHIQTGQSRGSTVSDLSRNYLTNIDDSRGNDFSGGGGGSSSLGGGGGSTGKDASNGTSTKGDLLLSGGYSERQGSSPSPSPSRTGKKTSFLPEIGGPRSLSPSPGTVQNSSCSESGARSLSRKIKTHANGSVQRVHLPGMEQVKRSHSVTPLPM